MNLVTPDLLIPIFIILGIFIFAAWLLQRINQRNFGKNTAIHIHSAISVGPNERILLLEAAGHWLLVGSAPGRVNTLLTLEHPPSFASAQNRTQSEKDQNNSQTENVAN